MSKVKHQLKMKWFFTNFDIRPSNMWVFIIQKFTCKCLESECPQTDYIFLTVGEGLRFVFHEIHLATQSSLIYSTNFGLTP